MNGLGKKDMTSRSIKLKGPVIPSEPCTNCNEVNYIKVNDEVYMDVDDDIAVLVSDVTLRTRSIKTKGPMTPINPCTNFKKVNYNKVNNKVYMDVDDDIAVLVSDATPRARSIKTKSPVTQSKPCTSCKEVNYIKANDKVYMDVDDDIAILVSDATPRARSTKAKGPVTHSKPCTSCKEVNYIKANDKVYMDVDDDIAILVSDATPRARSIKAKGPVTPSKPCTSCKEVNYIKVNEEVFMDVGDDGIAILVSDVTPRGRSIKTKGPVVVSDVTRRARSFKTKGPLTPSNPCTNLKEVNYIKFNDEVCLDVDDDIAVLVSDATPQTKSIKTKSPVLVSDVTLRARSFKTKGPVTASNPCTNFKDFNYFKVSDKVYSDADDDIAIIVTDVTPRTRPVKSKGLVAASSPCTNFKDVNYIQVNDKVCVDVSDDFAILVSDVTPRVQNLIRSREQKPCRQPAEGRAAKSCQEFNENFIPAKRLAMENRYHTALRAQTTNQELTEQNVKRKPQNISVPSVSQDMEKEDSDHQYDHCATIDAKLSHLFGSLRTLAKEINILLLGPTGVGKSTFINAFANYVTYGRLEEALNEEVICLIPMSSTVTDGQLHQQKVEVGLQSSIECQGDGQSRTEDCRCYEFNFDGAKIRLIDTPGLGDARDIIHNKLNFEQTLAFTGQFQALHGICIFMKPNEVNLTDTVQFCVKQLLSHLATSASRNIMFVFTNARGTHYRPGDTVSTLERILLDIRKRPPNVQIEFSERNTFCVDSEAFHFLVAIHQGIEFKVQDVVSFESSWHQSADECLRLVEHVLGLPPHPVKNKVSIDEALQLVHQLSKPLTDTIDNIETNLKMLEINCHKVLDDYESTNEPMAKSVITVIDIKIRKTGHPRTVCTYGQCRKIYLVGHIQKYHYPVSCHDPCTMRHVSGDIVDVPELRYCDAMDQDGYCNKCGCSYIWHMHIYYTTVEVLRKITEGQATIDEDAKHNAESKVQELQQMSAVLKKECSKILSVAAQFSHFLKYNAMAPHSGASEVHLMHFLENQKAMEQRGGLSQSTSLQRLEDMLKVYQKETAIFEVALSSNDQHASVPPEKIYSLKDDLYNLKTTGSYIQQLHQAQEQANLHEYKVEYVVISPKDRHKVKSNRNTAP